MWCRCPPEILRFKNSHKYVHTDFDQGAALKFLIIIIYLSLVFFPGARCSSVVRAFAHGVMGGRIDPSWGGPIELFLVPASVP